MNSARELFDNMTEADRRQYVIQHGEQALRRLMDDAFADDPHGPPPITIPKVVSRAAFEQMTPADRMAHVKAGGLIS